jgi:mannose/fructose/N-acetylgalactosamine-specific phosphotransferase system component IID
MKRMPFAAIFWRSFFIQACWSYPRMLGIGFLYAIQPAARLLFPDRPGRIEFLRRHSHWFNAQPYCASLALGYVLRREQEIAPENQATAEMKIQQLLKAKDDLCGKLGLMGDQIFWQLLKPAASALAITLFLILSLIRAEFNAGAAMMGIGLFLISFNSLHLWMRWWGLKTGYQADENLLSALTIGVIPKLRRGLAATGIWVALVLIITAFTFVRHQFGESGWAAFALGFMGVILMLKARVPIHLMLVVVALLCLIPVVLGLD